MEATESELTKTEDSTSVTVAEIRALKAIPDADSYQFVANAVLLLKTAQKVKTEEYKPQIETARANLEAVRKALSAFLDPWDAAIAYGKRLMVDYDQEQTRLARLRQAELDRQTKEKADREALELAEQLEKAGLKEEADHALTHVEEPAPVVVQKQTPKVESISYREVWKFEIASIADLPKEYMQPDLTKIGGVVRAMKGATNIKGVRAYSERIVAAKA